MRIIGVLTGAALAALAAMQDASAADVGQFLFQRGVAKSVGADIAADVPDGLHVGLCGTGSPMPDVSRKGPCAFALAGKRLFIFDMGPGASRNLGPFGVRGASTEAVFLTHLHSDHIDGLGDFMIQRWANSGATSPLPVYGPAGTAKVVDAINDALSFDRDYRVLEHGEAMNPAGYGGAAHEFEIDKDGATKVYDKDGVVITAIAVTHGHIWPAVGYRIDYKGRSAIISGDTSRSENLAVHAKGADILLHEALNRDMVDAMGDEFAKDGRPRMKTIFHEIEAIHATPVDAAETASEAGVKTLVLTHIIPPLPNPILYGSFTKGASEKFSGDIVVGEDGMLFSMPAGTDKITRRKLN